MFPFSLPGLLPPPAPPPAPAALPAAEATPRTIDDKGTGVALSHKFRVIVGTTGFTLDLGNWTKVEGLEVGFDLAENRAGDDWNRRLMALGVPKYQNIKLTRIATKKSSTAVKTWLDTVAKADATAHIGSLTIEVWDSKNDLVISWLVSDPVPVKWKISGALEAKTSGVLLEELEIAHDGFLLDHKTIPGSDGWSYTGDNVGMQMRFLVDIDGISLGGWSKCTGLGVNFKPHKQEEGGANHFVYWLADRMEYDAIKLTRVMSKVDSGKVFSFLQQRQAYFRGNLAADMFPSMAPGSTGKITLLSAKGEEVMTWSLRNVTPSKWTGPELAADGKGMAMETLELNHEGFL